MNTSKRSKDGTNSEPTEWATQQEWREIFPWDAHDATSARLVLVALNFYPTGEISSNQNFNTEEANERYALHQMMDQLTREDLRAVFRLCRAMVLFPEGVKTALELAQEQVSHGAAR